MCSLDANRCRAVLCLLLLGATIYVHADGCAGYMGTLTSTSDIRINVTFPTGVLTAPVQCTWVFIGAGGLNVYYALESFNPVYGQGDSVIVYPGINSSTTVAPLTPSAPINAYLNRSAGVNAITVVATVEVGLRQPNVGFIMRLSAPPGQPAPCANGSFTTLTTATGFGSLNPPLPYSMFPSTFYYTPPNWICTFYITIPGRRFYLNMLTPGSSSEPAGYVTVTDITAARNVTYDWTSFGQIYASSEGAMMVTYRTGPVVNDWNQFGVQIVDQGPQVSFCSGISTPITAPSGVFGNTNPPSSTYARYLPGTYCAFPVITAPGTRIVFNASFINTQIGEDYLYVYDGADANAPLLSVQTGKVGANNVVSKGDTMVTSSNQAYVIFQASNVTQRSIMAQGIYSYYGTQFGFQLNYTSVPMASVTPSLPYPAMPAAGYCPVGFTQLSPSTGTTSIAVTTTGYISGPPAGAGYARNQRCQWGFKGLRKRPIRIAPQFCLGGDDYVNVYYGSSANMTQLRTSLTGCPYYSTSASAPFYLAAETIVIEFFSDGNTIGDGFGFTLDISIEMTPQLEVETCPGGAPIDVYPGQYFGMPSLQSLNTYWNNFQLPPRSNCTWRLHAARAMRITVLRTYIQAGVVIRAYDGPSVSSPPVVLPNLVLGISGSFLTTGPEALVTLDSFALDLSGPYVSAYGIYMRLDELPPEAPYLASPNPPPINVTFDPDQPMVVYPPRGVSTTGMAYPSGPRTITWHVTLPPGATMIYGLTLNRFRILPALGDVVSVYDGYDTTPSRLLYNIHTDSSTPFPSGTNYNVLPTCNNFTVVFKLRAPMNYAADFGFDISTSALYGSPVSNPVCGPVYPPANNCVRPPFSNYNIAHPADYAAIRNCTSFTVPAYTTATIAAYECIPNFDLPNITFIGKGITFYMGAGASSLWGGGLSNLITNYGIINTNSQLSNLTFPKLQYAGTMLLYSQNGYPFNFVLPSLRAAGLLQIWGLTYTPLVSMPLLQTVTDFGLILSGTKDLQLPQLTFVYGCLTLTLMANLFEVNLPSAVYIQCTTGTGYMNAQSFKAPNLIATGYLTPGVFSLASWTNLSSVYIPQLQVGMIGLGPMKLKGTVDVSTLVIGEVCLHGYTGPTLNLPSFISGDLNISDTANLLSIDAPLWRAGQLLLEGNEQLAVINAPLFAYSMNVEVDSGNGGLQNITLPGFIHANALTIEAANYQFTEAAFPLMTSVGDLTIRSLELVNIAFPSLRTADSITLLATRLSSALFPALQIVGDVSMKTNLDLATLDLASVQYVYGSLYLSDSSATTLDIPSLTTVGGCMSLVNNRKLSAINACALSRIGTAVDIVSSPALSCFEAGRLFGRYTLNMETFDCNPSLVGTFGCPDNLTTTVDTVDCGFSMACIQSALSAAYSNVGMSVYIPPGTYTGCLAPLSFEGKAVTLRGSGEGTTVLDCQGDGSHFIFAQGETSGSVVEHMTLRGAGPGTRFVSSPSFTVTSAAPVFAYVTFEANQAVAGCIRGGAPAFYACTFRGNRGSVAGGLYVTNGASLTVAGSLFEANYGSGGGAIVFWGASASGAGSLLIAGTVIRDCSSYDKGAGVYADTAVRIEDSLIEGCTSESSGGGIAFVPTALTGVTLEARNLTLRNNRARQGGGLFFYSGAAWLEDTVIFNNSAINGGGIYAACSSSHLFLTNQLGACPGLAILLLRSHVTLNGAYQERSNEGGYAYGGGVYASHVVVTMNGTELSLNQGMGSGGGGVYAVASNVSFIHGTTIAQNSGYIGGGVYCDAAGICELDGSVAVTGNFANAGGGVYFCFSCTSGGAFYQLSLADGIVFTDNSASYYGADKATDLYTLVFAPSPPASTIISGGALGISGVFSVNMRDYYGTPVTFGIHVLQLCLLDAMTGTNDPLAAILGPTTVLTQEGTSTFTGVTPVVDRSRVGTTYQLRVYDSDTRNVVLTSLLTILGCAPGQGATEVPLSKGSTAMGLMCVDCAAGSFSADPSQPCTPCPAGSFASGVSSTTCTPCPAGQFQSTPGSASCVACPKGSASEPGAVSCDTAALTPANSPAVLSGFAVGVVVLIICVIIVVWRLVYARTRRKTMEKYYLDSDATVRQSDAQAGLSLTVKKLIGATSTVRIGGGQFADVYKARYNEEWIALKVMTAEAVSSTVAISEFQREVVALSALETNKHAGIISLRFFLERNPTCIAMEFCAGGTLKKHLRLDILAPAEKIRLAAEAASALAMVHSMDIAHNDVKTDNILLTEDHHVKLADFGISRMLNRPNSSPNGGRSRTLTTSGPFGGLVQGGSAYANSDRGPDSHSSDRSPQIGGLNSSTASMEGGVGGKFESNPVFGASETELSVYGGSEFEVDNYAFTPQYVDPHRLLNEHDLAPDTLKRADVFAFALVMWAIWAQDEPFAGVLPTTLIRQRMLNPDLRPNAPSHCHECYEALLARAWRTDGAARPTMEECYQELSKCLEAHFHEPLLAQYQHPRK